MPQATGEILIKLSITDFGVSDAINLSYVIFNIVAL
jgi:hypothetical protein